jgi:hypothetical protein
MTKVQAAKPDSVAAEAVGVKRKSDQFEAALPDEFWLSGETFDGQLSQSLPSPDAYR